MENNSLAARGSRGASLAWLTLARRSEPRRHRAEEWGEEKGSKPLEESCMLKRQLWVDARHKGAICLKIFLSGLKSWKRCDEKEKQPLNVGRCS